MDFIKRRITTPHRLISKSTRRHVMNFYYDSKRFTIKYWPHIIIVLLTLYLLTSLSFTTVETFQNRKEKNNEIILPLKFDKRTSRFTTLITFYENNQKTPIELHINLGTIYTSIVEKNVTYCVTPHAKYFEIPCNEKCHSIYGAKCSNSKYAITNTLNINKKLLNIIKRCNAGQKVNDMCGVIYDNNHSRWVKVYKTRSKIQIGDKIFHGKVFLDIISKLFSTQDINRNWNILGLGYASQQPNQDKESLLKQLNVKMFTIIDNPDTNDSKLILSPRLQYFKDPDIKSNFFTEYDKRYQLINGISIIPSTPKTTNSSSNSSNLSNPPKYDTSYPPDYVGKIYLTTSTTELIVNHQMKVVLLEIFRVLGLLTREEDDNAFTHFRKPLTIDYKPSLFPVIKFEFKVPNKQTEHITLRPRNYIKQIIPHENKAITHFIAKKKNNDAVFGMPFFKYRATTFNDETTTLFIKEIDLHPTHKPGSKLITNPAKAPHPMPQPKTASYPKKMVRKVTKKRRAPINVNLNYK